MHNAPMYVTLRNTLSSLGITLGLPVMVLSPNLFWTQFSLADHLGEGSVGITRAYVLAMLVPVAYGLWDALTRRDRSILGLYAMGRTLIGGAAASGLWTASGTRSKPQWMCSCRRWCSWGVRCLEGHCLNPSSSKGSSSRCRQRSVTHCKKPWSTAV
ncbi:Hypothetical protein; putative membrane protein (plasmid) [Deinococcus deserti VCD115]|uniref:Uncharacterized protein n=1 Tax=Deinococcus deserti (strain DSM 17065 / CIP 109153 / LMG 22923 / VCD115) TaxID=546414 RepID=C1D279_DEIDV|nr:Hypothetical protein; putative membrane protein [Deinococcus deserti VCD115]